MATDSFDWKAAYLDLVAWMETYERRNREASDQYLAMYKKNVDDGTPSPIALECQHIHDYAADEIGSLICFAKGRAGLVDGSEDAGEDAR